MKVGLISPPPGWESPKEHIMFKAGLVQFAPAWESPEESIKILDKLFEKKVVDCDLLIFPEMTLTGFTMHAQKFAEEIDGPTTQYFIKLAKKHRKHIFAGIIEKDGDCIYNSLVHFDNQGIITARYRKIHPFSYVHEEKNYTAGDTLVITKTDYVKIGLSICYDLRFPELYRMYGKSRTDIIINIANWPIPRINHWISLLKARAIENQCYVIGVNRTGYDPNNNYNGLSGVFDPSGNEILLAENKEGIFSVPIELDKVKEVRKAFPFLNDIKLL